MNLQQTTMQCRATVRLWRLHPAAVVQAGRRASIAYLSKEPEIWGRSSTRLLEGDQRPPSCVSHYLACYLHVARAGRDREQNWV